MKKVLKVSLTWLIGLLSIGLVFAQETNFERLTRAFASGASNTLNLLFLGPDTLTILLLGLLLWMILYSTVKTMDLFGKNPWLSAIISLIVTVIAFIFLRDQPVFLKLAEGNIGGLGAGILTIFPFLIALYFTMAVSKSQMMARGVWGVFSLYFLVTLFTVWGNSTGKFWSSPETIWFVGALIASLALLIFMPTFREKWWNFELESKTEKADRTIDKANAFIKANARGLEELAKRKKH